MALQILLQDPNGVIYDITNYQKGGHGVVNLDETSINRQIEQETNIFDAGSLQLTLANDDGWFTTQWASLNPNAKWDESTGKGCWYIQIKKNIGGIPTVTWDGDLDPLSVPKDLKHGTLSVTFIGTMKRLDSYDGNNLKRNIPNPLHFTCERGHRVLTLKDGSGNPLSVADSKLVVGDVIKVTQLVRNGAPIDQELIIRHIGPSTTPSLTAYQVKVNAYLKRAYTVGVCITPWYRDLTLSQAISTIFAAEGITSGIVVNSVNNNKVIGLLDSHDKSHADLFTELCTTFTALLYKTPDNYIFQDRNIVRIPTTKVIDTLLMEDEETAIWDRYFTTVVAKGPNETTKGLPDVSNRFYRAGNYYTFPSKQFDVQTDFFSSILDLKWIAESAYNYWAVSRKTQTVPLMDDGTSYQIMDTVSLRGEAWWVIGVEEPLRSIDPSCLSHITLTLLQVNGTSPPAVTDDPHDDNPWNDPPYPPQDLELGRGADDPAGRPAWWSAFRNFYPNDENYPIVKELGVVKGENGSKIHIFGRLWAIRWKAYTDGAVTDDPPDGFEITIYKVGNDPSKPVPHNGLHGYKNPKCDSNGYYYYPWYKTIATTHVGRDKEVVIQTYDVLNGMSAYSDPVSTADTEDGNPDSVKKPSLIVSRDNVNGQDQLSCFLAPSYWMGTGKMNGGVFTRLSGGAFPSVVQINSPVNYLIWCNAAYVITAVNNTAGTISVSGSPPNDTTSDGDFAFVATASDKDAVSTLRTLVVQKTKINGSAADTIPPGVAGSKAKHYKSFVLGEEGVNCDDIQVSFDGNHTQNPTASFNWWGRARDAVNKSDWALCNAANPPVDVTAPTISQVSFGFPVPNPGYLRTTVTWAGGVNYTLSMLEVWMSSGSSAVGDPDSNPASWISQLTTSTIDTGTANAGTAHVDRNTITDLAKAYACRLKDSVSGLNSAWYIQQHTPAGATIPAIYDIPITNVPSPTWKLYGSGGWGYHTGYWSQLPLYFDGTATNLKIEIYASGDPLVSTPANSASVSAILAAGWSVFKPMGVGPGTISGTSMSQWVQLLTTTTWSTPYQLYYQTWIFRLTDGTSYGAWGRLNIDSQIGTWEMVSESSPRLPCINQYSFYSPQAYININGNWATGDPHSMYASRDASGTPFLLGPFNIPSGSYGAYIDIGSDATSYTWAFYWGGAYMTVYRTIGELNLGSLLGW